MSPGFLPAARARHQRPRLNSQLNLKCSRLLQKVLQVSPSQQGLRLVVTGSISWVSAKPFN